MFNFKQRVFNNKLELLFDSVREKHIYGNTFYLYKDQLEHHNIQSSFKANFYPYTGNTWLCCS